MINLVYKEISCRHSCIFLLHCQFHRRHLYIVFVYFNVQYSKKEPQVNKEKRSFDHLFNVCVFDGLKSLIYNNETYDYVKKVISYELESVGRKLQDFRSLELEDVWLLYMKYFDAYELVIEPYYDAEDNGYFPSIFVKVNDKLLLVFQDEAFSKDKSIYKIALSTYYSKFTVKYIESEWLTNSICNAWSKDKLINYIMSNYNDMIVPKIREALLMHQKVRQNQDPEGYFKELFPFMVKSVYDKISEIDIPDHTDENGLNKTYTAQLISDILDKLIDLKMPILFGKSLLFRPKSASKSLFDVIPFEDKSSSQCKTIALNVSMKVVSFTLPMRIWVIDNDWFEYVLDRVSLANFDREWQLEASLKHSYGIISFDIYENKNSYWLVELYFAIRRKRDSIRVSINKENFGLVIKKMLFLCISKIPRKFYKVISYVQQDKYGKFYVLIVPKLV